MPDICPHLGLAGDPTLMRSQADAAHRCYAVSPPGTPTLEYQGEYCLLARHAVCPHFVPVDPSAPVAAQVTKRARPALVRLLPWLLLGAVLLAVIAVFAGDLLRPPASPSVASTAVVAAATSKGATAARVAGTPSAVAGGARLAQGDQGAGGYSIPTPEPGGRVLALAPRPGDAGWWSSAETRGKLGDSFLYAGFYQGQAFVSAARFELGSVPRGAPIQEAAVVLTGLNDQRFNPAQGGTWSAQLLAVPGLDNLRQRNFQEVYNAPVAAALFPTLFPSDIGQGVTNVLSLDPAAREWLAKQILDGAEAVIVRITGPTAGDSVFAWDGGSGPATGGAPPRLVLSLGAAPPTPPPLPTEAVIVVTVTPTPANVLTVAAQAATASALSAIGTSTPLPYRLVTATPLPANMATAQALGFALGERPIVVDTATPANRATATYYAEYATAVAMTTGTFTPVPTNAVTPIIIMPTPIPKNVVTAAAQMRTATAVVAKFGTVTPPPFNAVVATPTDEPAILVNTAVPENRATAQAISAYATAVAATTGTFTPIPKSAIWATPTPRPTGTPTPTRAPLVLYVDQLTPTATPTPPSAQPRTIPADLKGKILFRSDRDGGVKLFSYDPASKRLAYLTEEWPYALALARDARAPDGQRYVTVMSDGSDTPQVVVRDTRNKDVPRPVTTGSKNYDPVWSPAGETIAYVSEEPGNPEIYTVRSDGSDKRRLTTNGQEIDKHPSWSPDGRQILYSSNSVTGRFQLWIMNADGSGQRILMESQYNDWDPIWVK